MSKFFFIIPIISLLVNCTSKELVDDPKLDLIAEVGDLKLYRNQLDSIISDEIFYFKTNAINEYFSNALLEREAKIRGGDLNEFITDFIPQDFSSKLEIELKNNNYNEIKTKDSALAQNIMNTAVHQVKLKSIKNKLLEESNLSNYLEKDFHQYFNANLEGPFLSNAVEGNPVEIIIISNYECSYCFDIHNRLRQLVDEYRDIASFKFIYFGDQILKFAKAPIAADKQGSFDKMNDFIFEKVQDGTITDSLIINFAKSLKLNLNDFIQDYNSVKVHQVIANNIDQIKNNKIYKTPTLIINNKIYDEHNAISILETILKTQRKKTSINY